MLNNYIYKSKLNYTHLIFTITIKFIQLKADEFRTLKSFKPKT